MDAKYCSSVCRMNALRVRKRENRLAERALAKATAESVPDHRARLEAAKAAFLARAAGARLAAQLPNLIEDPWMMAQAEFNACKTIIDHYEKRKEALALQLAKVRKPDELNVERQVVKVSEPITFPREVVLIGVSVMSGELEGEAVVYLGKKRPHLQSSERSTHRAGGWRNVDE